MARNPSIGNPGPYAAEALRAGMSATEGLEAIRAAGGGVNTQTWYRAYSEARLALDAEGALSRLDAFAPLDYDAFVPWSAGRSGAYAYQVQVTTIDDETGMMSQQPYTVITDEILSPAEAAEAAFGDFTEADADDIYGRTTVAAVTTKAFRMTGPGGA